MLHIIDDIVCVLLVPSTGENVSLFASLISRTAQDIDILIESLPNQEYTPEKQVLNQSFTTIIYHNLWELIGGYIVSYYYSVYAAIVCV